MIDLRSGMVNNPIQQTPIFGNWGCAFRNETLEEVISFMDKKALMVTSGIDSLNPLEDFAIRILMGQYEYRNGKISKEDLTSD